MPVQPRLVEKYTYRDILEAYLDCRKRKRNTDAAQCFELDVHKNLDKLLYEINNNEYEPGASNVFVVTHPKAREVWAAQFRDRIAHHLVCRDLAPFFKSRIIPQNCACVPGRGTLLASQYVERYCRSVTESWTKPAWYLQFDIQNFFVSISKTLLWSIITKSIPDESSLTMRLFRQIIFQDITVNAIIKRKEYFELVPYHKSLWHTDKDHGLPIGNLPSQICASWILLDVLDKYAKHELHCRHYVRYVDDGVIVSKDREQLEEWKNCIRDVLRDRCQLTLSEKKTFVKPIQAGINFVGRVIYPYRTYVRKMNLERALQCAHAAHNILPDQEMISSVNSYLGLFRHSSSYNIRKNICKVACTPIFVEHDEEYTKIFCVY